MLMLAGIFEVSSCPDLGVSDAQIWAVMDLGTVITIALGLDPRPCGNSLPLPSECASLWCGVLVVVTPGCIHPELCAPSKSLLSGSWALQRGPQQSASILPMNTPFSFTFSCVCT